MELSQLDPRFHVNKTIDSNGIFWRVATDPCFSLFGLMHDKDGYKRMDSTVAKEVSEGVFGLHRHTSGGRLIFETNSDRIALSMQSSMATRSTRTPLSGSSGFDIYIDQGEGFQFWRLFEPPIDFAGCYESLVKLPNNPTANGYRKVLIHFPLYNSVDKLWIGVDENAQVMPYNPYLPNQRIVYYGSSITQGACAARPSCSYPAIVSLHNQIDFLCLGFAGNAHGEQAMAEYIANQPMSVFVMDYDHNDIVESVLEERHLPFYETVRKAYPDIPIIIMSAPYSAADWQYLSGSRKAVIRTFEKVKARGDNVYFIDGMTVYGRFREFATVDHCHPNELGFMCMAQSVLETLDPIK